MSVAADPTAEVKNFPGRDDLEKLLFSMLPSGWWEAIQSSDEATLKQLKSGLHSPDIVAQLGSLVGWLPTTTSSMVEEVFPVTMLAQRSHCSQRGKFHMCLAFGAPARRPNDSTVVKR